MQYFLLVTYFKTLLKVINEFSFDVAVLEIVRNKFIFLGAIFDDQQRTGDIFLHYFFDFVLLTPSGLPPFTLIPNTRILNFLSPVLYMWIYIIWGIIVWMNGKSTEIYNICLKFSYAFIQNNIKNCNNFWICRIGFCTFNPFGTTVFYFNS